MAMTGRIFSCRVLTLILPHEYYFLIDGDYAAFCKFEMYFPIYY
jgi:hypothetical protein